MSKTDHRGFIQGKQNHVNVIRWQIEELYRKMSNLAFLGVHFGHWFGHNTLINDHQGLIRGKQRNFNVFIWLIEKICKKLQIIANHVKFDLFEVNFGPRLALQSAKRVILWYGRAWKLTIEIFSIIFEDIVPLETQNNTNLALKHHF